jgi:hypothetical protein
MQAHELSARRLAQRKHTIPGALRRADRAFTPVIAGHIILLPHAGKICEEFLWFRIHEPTKHAKYARGDF